MFILIVILTMLAATPLVANAQPVGKVPRTVRVVGEGTGH
jgi:hypothetical protein